MKRYIASTSRGHSFPHDPGKQNLRAIVNDIYDEVEERGYIDYYANIRSAGRGYKVQYFRTKEEWMDQDTANKLAENINKVINDLGYQDNAYTEVAYAGFSKADEDYGHPCYEVFLRVKPGSTTTSPKSIGLVNLYARSYQGEWVLVFKDIPEDQAQAIWQAGFATGKNRFSIETEEGRRVADMNRQTLGVTSATSIELNSPEDWADYLTRKCRLNKNDSETLLHDLNNLRADEWLDIVPLKHKKAFIESFNLYGDEEADLT